MSNGSLAENHNFSKVLELIQEGRKRAFQAVNKTLISTYWDVGCYLSHKIESSAWGKAVVKELATWLHTQAPALKGFSASNLWRMAQFYDTYAQNETLAPLVRDLDWSKNLLIMAQCKTVEERTFYIKSAIHAHWSKRELADKIKTGTFERTLLSDKQLAPAVRALTQDVTGVFKDNYLLDFLDLPEPHLEKDLQSALVANLRKFLLELGSGFTFVGEKVRVQVGNRDFELDLLFYHRDLQCLVAFELKIGQFEPSHLGQLSFYLEALDREHKRPHEKPSIGVLLCRTKDDEVVELALNSTLSPTLVSEYETTIIPKALLREKLHEWGELLTNEGDT